MNHDLRVRSIAQCSTMPQRTTLVVTLVVTLGALVLLASQGCSSRGSELGRVHGHVTLDGEPLSDALVTFKPSKGRPSLAETDDQGMYLLSYRVDEPGARIGAHKVTVSTFKPADGLFVKKVVPERVPPKYNRRTTLTAQVDSGSNQIDFDLKSR
jgi:hypothetical protein